MCFHLINSFMVLCPIAYFCIILTVILMLLCIAILLDSVFIATFYHFVTFFLWLLYNKV